MKEYCININVLNIKYLISTFVSTFSKGNIFDFQRPYVPFQLKFLVGTNQWNRELYNILTTIEQKQPRKCETLWSLKLNPPLNSKVWPIIYKICSKTTQDNTMIWFQYKILYNILPTRNYLYNLKLADSDLCGFCNTRTETILHLFTECPIVNTLWENMRQWVSNKIHIQIDLSKIVKVFGYLIQDQNFRPINSYD